jgi:hypothetical protein
MPVSTPQRRMAVEEPLWRHVAAAEISRPAKSSPGKPFRKLWRDRAFA